MAKGNADCHLPNDNYRDGWDRVFGEKKGWKCLTKCRRTISNEEYQGFVDKNGFAPLCKCGYVNGGGKPSWERVE